MLKKQYLKEEKLVAIQNIILKDLLRVEKLVEVYDLWEDKAQLIEVTPIEKIERGGSTFSILVKQNY